MNQAITTMPRLQLPTEAVAMMHLATQLSASRTIPSVFQKSPADCFNVLAVCMRFGFDFYSTIWECSIIKGRLFFSGKMVHAMLNASGYLAERLTFDYSGEGADRKVTVRARLQGETGLRIVDVFLAEVRTANEHWKSNTDQMLSYAGARIWSRRHCPEVLLGLMFVDEAEMIDVTPKRTAADAADLGKLSGGTVTEAPPPIEQPAEPSPPVPPYKLDPPMFDNPEGWRSWAEKFISLVRGAETIDDINRWCDLNKETLGKMQQSEAKMHRMLDNAIVQQLRAREDVPA